MRVAARREIAKRARRCDAALPRRRRADTDHVRSRRARSGHRSCRASSLRPTSECAQYVHGAGRTGRHGAAGLVVSLLRRDAQVRTSQADCGMMLRAGSTPPPAHRCCRPPPPGAKHGAKVPSRRARARGEEGPPNSKKGKKKKKADAAGGGGFGDRSARAGGGMSAVTKPRAICLFIKRRPAFPCVLGFLSSSPSATTPHFAMQLPMTPHSDTTPSLCATRCVRTPSMPRSPSP